MQDRDETPWCVVVGTRCWRANTECTLWHAGVTFGAPKGSRRWRLLLVVEKGSVTASDTASQLFGVNTAGILGVQRHPQIVSPEQGVEPDRQGAYPFVLCRCSPLLLQSWATRQVRDASDIPGTEPSWPGAESSYHACSLCKKTHRVFKADMFETVATPRIHSR